jgi:5-methylcytosine-specific restriction endonuclease McrA
MSYSVEAAMKSAPLIPADPLRRRCQDALAAHRKRARAEGQEIDYGLADLEELARDTPICPYCHNLIPPAGLTFDHRTPTCRGGRHALDNLVACCTSCNVGKGLLSDEEYQMLLQLLGTFHPRAAADVLGRLRAGGARYAHGRGPGAGCA